MHVSSERELAARAWAFRWSVETIAERAFGWLARELSELGHGAELALECASVADDERRHVVLCAELARSLGAAERATIDDRVRLAPASLARADALVYEIVARCCIAETESTATLLELLPRARGEVRAVVHRIARDEVRHARLGWRFLASVARGGRDLGWLGEHVPAMLATGGAPLFADAPQDDLALDDAAHGRLARVEQRDIFVATLRDVVFPGLELHGVSTAAARAWLAAQTRYSLLQAQTSIRHAVPPFD